MTEREQKRENDAEAYCIKADFKFFQIEGNELPKSTITEVIDLYRKSAWYNNSKAMMALGKIYEEGLYVKQDNNESLKWYQNAAEN